MTRQTGAEEPGAASRRAAVSRAVDGTLAVCATADPALTRREIMESLLATAAEYARPPR